MLTLATLISTIILRYIIASGKMGKDRKAG